MARAALSVPIIDKAGISGHGNGMGKPTLSRARRSDAAISEADWIVAGADALANEGVRGVQIPALCARLGVTKGSFYWHFASLADLLARVLGHWRQRATTDLIDRLTEAGVDARQAIAELLAFPRRARSRRAAGLEPAIRGWARRDTDAGRAVAEVDALRLQYFERMLLRHGVPEAEARPRAYIAYCIMMGDGILHNTLGDSVSDDAHLAAAMTALGLSAGEVASGTGLA